LFIQGEEEEAIFENVPRTPFWNSSQDLAIFAAGQELRVVGRWIARSLARLGILSGLTERTKLNR
jgi:hypothetical protein